MKLKKIFTAILMILVILSLGISFLFTGGPQRPSANQTDPSFPPPPTVTDFQGPTGPPSVKGPTSPPPGQSNPTSLPLPE